MQGYATAQVISKTSTTHPFNALRNRMEAAVRECTAVAGEQLWCINCDSGTSLNFTIISVSDPRDYVEVNLEPDARGIVCRFGPAVSKPELRFEIEDESLIHGGATLRIPAAASFVLDQLIFPDE